MNVFFVCFLNILYGLAILFFLPVLLYRALREGKYRRGFRQKWLGRAPRRKRLTEPGRKRLWFHAVSVGEVNLLRPLLKLIDEEHPEWECVVSTTSNTGMALATKLYGGKYTVFYCPLDFSWSVRKAFSRLNPDALILAEQELWPNLIDTATKNGVKVFLINGRFSEKGYRRYRYIRRLVMPMLRRLDGIAVQSETYAGWFHQLGARAETIHVTGSMKFDGASSNRANPGTLWVRQLAGIDDDDIVFLAGSTQEPEELFAVECYEHLKHDFPKLRLILVPRHPERFDAVARMLGEQGVLWQRRSRLEDAAKPSDTPEKKDPPDAAPLQGSIAVRPRILLVDSVGELGAWWGTARIGFVGGSIHKRGGQNMIEPAAYGAAVCFGPNTKNFRDIVALLLRDEAAVVVHDQREMEAFVRRCLEEPEYREKLGHNGRELVARQLGATRLTLELLEQIIAATEESDSSV